MSHFDGDLTLLAISETHIFDRLFETYLVYFSDELDLDMDQTCQKRLTKQNNANADQNVNSHNKQLFRMIRDLLWRIFPMKLSHTTDSCESQCFRHNSDLRDPREYEYAQKQVEVEQIFTRHFTHTTYLEKT